MPEPVTSKGGCLICEEIGGPLVECVVCGHSKAPRGRSVGLGAYHCDRDCPGYNEPPEPGYLWPGERYGDSLGHMDWHEEAIRAADVLLRLLNAGLEEEAPDA
jgi:hypothetical protein